MDNLGIAAEVVETLQETNDKCSITWLVHGYTDHM